MILVATVLLYLGLFFILAAIVGILRLPDFYTRLHAMGKCDTLGVSLVLVALVLYEGLSLPSLKILGIILCVGLANPTVTHALGRAAWKAGVVPWERSKES